MKAFLLTLGLAWIAQGADVTVKLADGESPTLLKLVSLERLFEPQEDLKPSVVTDDTHVYREVKSGSYSIVIWEANAVWRPSPTYDQSITVENKDVEVLIRKAIQKYDFMLKLPPKMYADVARLYKGFTFVPCRLQRLQELNAPTFGYRWLILSKVGDSELSSPAEISSGSYLLTIPYPAAAEAWPPPRVPRQHLTHPLLAFRLTIGEDMSVDIGVEGIEVVIKHRELK